VCIICLQDSSPSFAVATQPTSSHGMIPTDRKPSTYDASDYREPADDDVIDDAGEEELGDSCGTPPPPGELDANYNDVVTSRVTSFVTSFVTSATPDGDVRRPRTTADGCEDDDDGAGALDLIRHYVLCTQTQRC